MIKKNTFLDPTPFDYVVVGGGILGLTTCYELLNRYPQTKIALLEKEDSVANHASGRNSGVLHAGFYYSKDSLKAQFCKLGNRAMKQFCKEHGLYLNTCGKLVVSQDIEELRVLEELKKRGDTNGVELEWVEERDLSKYNPAAKTFGRALFSPSTASVDPLEVCDTLRTLLLDSGVKFFFNTRFVTQKNTMIRTTEGCIESGYTINCAGTYADKIARQFNFAKNLKIVPFKGVYLYSNDTGLNSAFNTHIYPVPNLANPFLGVHFTIASDGRVKIGPTAIPAFWRENYGGVDGFHAPEAGEILSTLTKLFFRNSFGFRRLAYDEVQKYRKSYLQGLAKKLVQNVPISSFDTWGKPGIRAQLVDLKTHELVQDFVLHGDKNSLHILNAVSPAFTCAFPVAEHVVERIEQLRNKPT